MSRLAMILLVLFAPHFAFGAEGTNIGEQLYANNCASCHGVNLEGQENWQTPNDEGILPAPPHDQTGHTWHHDDDLLFSYTKLGGAEFLKQSGVTGFASGMPAFDGLLDDAEIIAILDFIKSTWPKKQQDIQSERSKAKDQ